MRKFAFLGLVLCIMCSTNIVSAGFFVDERCDDFDAKVGQYILRDGGDEYSAYRCVSDGDTNDLENETDIQFCQNANKCLLGKEEAMNNDDHRRLCIRTSKYVKTSNDKGKGTNFILSDFSGKSDACYFCPEGYQFDMDDQECEEAHSQSCTFLSAAKCKKEARYLTEEGGHGCYICDQKENGTCANGNRIFMSIGFLGNSTEAKRNQIWTCLAGQKRWESRDIGICPGSSDLSAEYAAGRAKAATIENPDRTNSHNNASSFIITNNEPCLRWECDSSKGYKEQGGKCVYDSDYQTYCTQNGGEFANGICTCKDILGLESADSGKTCKCKNGSDYIWDKNKRQCVKSGAAIQRDRNNQQQQRQAQAAKEKCENSGGTWSSGKCNCDNSKNLRLESGECVCLDSTNYRRDGNQCILTDAAALQRECEGAAATGAYWDLSTKQCRCSNPQHAFINKQCRMNPAIEACNQIPGAKWNQIANECRCTDPKKELNANGTACVETDEARQEREESEATAQLSAAKTKITKSASALKNMSEGFKVSVWKNKEGNFNTARLASDSIAGVVLGTAGGLITSNVVKKNQVKSGFEDIQCTIGGQVVADWGDEFRVGIQ